MAREIPGWEPITCQRLHEDKSTYMVVRGQWYRPRLGWDSLQEVVDEWLESLWTAYYHCTFTGKGGRRFGYVSDGDHAIRILREWGLLDEDGNRVEVKDETEAETE